MVDIRSTPKPPLYCSFCGKSDAEVRLIAGPTVFICAECVSLCRDILETGADGKEPRPMPTREASDLWRANG